jgi:predicted nucleotidyltransferase
MKRDQVLKALQANRGRLASEFGVMSLVLFGSVARDQARPDSDIDLLVEFDRPVGYFGLFRLQDHLADLLGAPVDLGTPASLKERVRSRVLAEGIHVG